MKRYLEFYLLWCIRFPVVLCITPFYVFVMAMESMYGVEAANDVTTTYWKGIRPWPESE